MDQHDAGPTQGRTSGQRRSRLAIAAVVAGLLSWFTCWVPIVTHALGVAGIVLALLAVRAIRRSGGELKGAGMCAVALVLAAVGMTAGTAVVALAAGEAQRLHTLASVVERIDAGDAAAEVPLLDPALRSRIDDRVLADFRDRVRARVGAVQWQPRSLVDQFRTIESIQNLRAARELAGSVRSANADERVLVQTMRFANGWAAVVLVTPRGLNALTNVGVAPLEGDRDVIWLVDRSVAAR